MTHLADISLFEALQTQAHERMGISPMSVFNATFKDPRTVKPEDEEQLRKIKAQIKYVEQKNEQVINDILQQEQDCLKRANQLAIADYKLELQKKELAQDYKACLQDKEQFRRTQAANMYVHAKDQLRAMGGQVSSTLDKVIKKDF